MRSLIVLGILGLGSFVTGACFHSPHSPPDVLQIQIPKEPMSLDPSLFEDGVSLQILSSMHEGLVGYDRAGQLQKRIAESFEISSQGRRYQFKLRPGVFWSDGQRVRAKDFVVAFRRILDPTTGSKLASLFFPIRGARSVYFKKAPAQNLGVWEEKENLVIELERPVPYFMDALTLPLAWPLRQDILDQNKGRWPLNAPVTGPYQMVAHRMDQKIILEINPHYWGQVPLIRQIEFRVVVDESTALRLFEHGELDILTRVSFLDLARLKRKGQIQTDPYFATYLLAFNCRKPPFQDRVWRRAVAGAIRRDEITEILGSGESPSSSLVPKGLEGYIPYRDPRLLFSDSIQSVRNQVETVPIEVVFDTGSRNSRMMEKIQEDMKKSLGLSVSLSHMDWHAYLSTIRSPSVQIFRWGWLAPFQDPISHLKIFTSGDINNYFGWSNSQYDLLVSQIEEMSPGSARAFKIKQAQKILLEDEAVVIPLYNYVSNTGVSSRVKNFRMNPFGVIPLQEVFLQN